MGEFYACEKSGHGETGGVPRRRCPHPRLPSGKKQMRKRFGDLAAQLARQHIKSDLMQEGWTETDRFPRDEADYVWMELF